jgi:hypothetical protein
MNTKIKFLFFFGCLCSTLAFAQLDTYGYKMEVSGISEQWHKITLPDAVFEKISSDMNDLRIYGITPNDTIEAPYLLLVGTEKKGRKKIDFKLLNANSNANGHYFTYEIPTTETINEIQLDFENENFDWKIRLEGSHNQQEWFTILKEYRILSIKNEQTDYSYTDLNFANSKYRFYRLLVKSGKKPALSTAKISLDAKIGANYRDYGIAYTNIKSENKQTFIDIDLKKRLPVSFIKINISDTFDYYRPYTISYRSDSVATEKGMKYMYTDIRSGTLNPIEKNELRFTNTLARKLRVTVHNYDNQPLNIEGVEVKGNVHELAVRFTEPADYYLAYEKTNARKPQYDISRATSKIPNNLSDLTLGKAQVILKKGMPVISPLFENKLWVLSIMCFVILVLGVFTLKMMRKK